MPEDWDMIHGVLSVSTLAAAGVDPDAAAGPDAGAAAGGSGAEHSPPRRDGVAASAGPVEEDDAELSDPMPPDGLADDDDDFDCADFD